MLQHTLSILESAENIAADGGEIGAVLTELRRLSLDEFGLLMISLPNGAYPSISSILPPMASADVQKAWTGDSGENLLRVTAAFVRQTENNFIRFAGRPLQGSQILDFGCGYGRIFRMMYYYSDPENLWGVDAWDKSLEHVRNCALPGNFAKSDPVPEELPVDGRDFDLIFAFSVFTHLAPQVADKCLRTIKNYVKHDGLFIATIRPPEYWAWHDMERGTDIVDHMILDHENNGIAYCPHIGPEGTEYGDTSMTFDYFNQFGWELLGHDWSPIDPMQLSVILRNR